MKIYLNWLWTDFGVGINIYSTKYSEMRFHVSFIILWLEINFGFVKRKPIIKKECTCGGYPDCICNITKGAPFDDDCYNPNTPYLDNTQKPKECIECGKWNSDNCNTCSVINGQFDGV